ncbi:Uncharacterised protein [Mycobacteroides abscessus]|nr:Uncharacterised protein [Mycobacteroides abscessus]
MDWLLTIQLFKVVTKSILYLIWQQQTITFVPFQSLIMIR